MSEDSISESNVPRSSGIIPPMPTLRREATPPAKNLQAPIDVPPIPMLRRDAWLPNKSSQTPILLRASVPPVKPQCDMDIEAGPTVESIPAANVAPRKPEEPEALELLLTPSNATNGKFLLTPEDLTNPIAGSKKPVVFDWQAKQARFEPFGGRDAIFSAIRADVVAGLKSEDEADMQARREFFSTNERTFKPAATYWELIWAGLHDTTLLILIAAAAVSIPLGVVFEGQNGWIEGAAILFAVVIVLNVAAINDIQKEKQFQDLNAKNSQRMVKVLRSGQINEIMVDYILVGDIVKLEAGDMVPADGLFLSGTNVKMDESSLTGETDMVTKSVESPFLISGSIMISGESMMVVIGVGPNSLQGILSKDMEQEEEKTPLQVKLEELANQIGLLGLAIAVVVFVAMFITHMVVWSKGLGTVDNSGNRIWSGENYSQILSYFIIAITVLVVAIPEGLPLAVTISLAYSMKQMQKDALLVRHLEACETMGGATAICTDKTGTLTQNKMTVVQMWIYDCEEKGFFLNSFGNGSTEGLDELYRKLKSLPEEFTNLLYENCCMNTTADMVYDQATKEHKISGSKTDGALLNLAQSSGADYRNIRQTAKIEIRYPFESARKRSSVLVRMKSNSGSEIFRLYVKGAAEMILRLSTHIIDSAGKVKELDGDFAIDSEGNISGSGKKFDIAKNFINVMAADALRTIALAYRDYDQTARDRTSETIQFLDSENKGTGDCPALETGLILLGIAGVQDPIRPEVPLAVKQCQEAGITVRMITGDNITTAIAIAKQCNIYTPNTQELAVEGPDFREQMACREDYFQRYGPRITVMARSSPQDKHLMVSNLMDNGQIVAVTGDGTNDGPALKKANVGFAMGIAGTDVAKNACDIVITDDNFASIVQAVSWGRNTYDSIRKFLQFQLTVNLEALLISVIGAVVLSDTPLKATQMLWVNLIMDAFAALALATEKPTPELLQRRPQGKNDSLISSHMQRNILGQFFYQAIVLITIIFCGEVLFEIPSGRGLPQSTATVHYTIIFHVFVMMQVFNEISARKLEDELNILKGLSTNATFLAIIAITIVVQYLVVQYGGPAVIVTGLTAAQHGMCIIFGLGGIAVTFLMKLVPATLFPPITNGKNDLTNQQKLIWSALTRRKSNPFSSSYNSSENGNQMKNAALLEAIDENIRTRKHISAVGRGPSLLEQEL